MQNLKSVADWRERIAQLMGERRQELALTPVSLRQVRGQLPKCLLRVLALGDIGDRPIEAAQSPAGPLAEKIDPSLSEHPPRRPVRMNDAILGGIWFRVDRADRGLDCHPDAIPILRMNAIKSLLIAD